MPSENGRCGKYQRSMTTMFTSSGFDLYRIVSATSVLCVPRYQTSLKDVVARCVPTCWRSGHNGQCAHKFSALQSLLMCRPSPCENHLPPARARCLVCSSTVGANDFAASGFLATGFLGKSFPRPQRPRKGFRRSSEERRTEEACSSSFFYHRSRH